MRDLKHLIFFENLLQEANNSLVKEAAAEGRLALGYNCSYIPEPLLDVEGAFGVRLRAPRSQSPDMATYYMTNISCPYAKSILERAFEGGYNFIDALIGQECCTTMNRMEQYFDYCKLNPKEHFITTFVDVPMFKGEWYSGYYCRQLEEHLIKPLETKLGLNFSDEKIRKAVEQHNEVCRIITEIGDMRIEDNPPVTGYEFHVINLVSQTCPKDLILPYLRETLEEIKQRECEPKPWYRARIAVAGSEIDDPEFTKLLESCGAFVVLDRYCFGSQPGREEIEIREGERAIEALARHYLTINVCPRLMDPDNIVGRKQNLYDLCIKFKAEGCILENMKFCEYWGYERAQTGAWFLDGFKLPGTLPTCQIEKEYNMAAAGQLRTRFQAFVESLEIKRLRVGD